MHHRIEVFADAQAVAQSAARFVVDTARACLDRQSQFSFAVSGGHTPWAMFEVLVTLSMPWDNTVIYQVDERVAPTGDADRNLTQLTTALAGANATVIPMPVEDSDLVAGAARYEQQLPSRIDLVHLGLGPDGHTASLVPGDDVLTEATHRVGVTSSVYQGRRRMTLTYPGLRSADQVLWLVTGADKAQPLQQLLAADPSIPAGRVVVTRSTIFADRDAVDVSPTT